MINVNDKIEQLLAEDKDKRIAELEKQLAKFVKAGVEVSDETVQ